MPIEELEESDQEEIQKREPDKPRINPRLVFVNPDVFFTDLLMEEEEQG